MQYCSHDHATFASAEITVLLQIPLLWVYHVATCGKYTYLECKFELKAFRGNRILQESRFSCYFFGLHLVTLYIAILRYI